MSNDQCSRFSDNFPPIGHKKYTEKKAAEHSPCGMHTGCDKLFFVHFDFIFICLYVYTVLSTSRHIGKGKMENKSYFTLSFKLSANSCDHYIRRSRLMTMSKC